MHICRRNCHSDYIFEGRYDLIPDQLATVNVDGLFLEYDNDRSGVFQLLSNIYAKNRKAKSCITNFHFKIS
jgi:hypothetical protein